MCAATSGVQHPTAASTRKLAAQNVSSCVIAGLALVLGMVPLCSYARVQCLQGVAFASSLPSTKWTACFAAASAPARLSRPAVLLPCRALGAEPEDLLAAVRPRV